MKYLKFICFFLLIIKTQLQTDESVDQRYELAKNLTTELRLKNQKALAVLNKCNTNLSKVVIFNKKRIEKYFDNSLVDDISILEEIQPFLEKNFELKMLVKTEKI